MASTKNILCGLVAASLVSAAAYANPNRPVEVGARLKTVFAIGLQWDFGDMQPQLVGSVRRTETTEREAVHGVKIDLAVPLRMDLSFDPTVRVLGLSGGRDVQGELGFGWRVRASEFMASVGVQAPYTNGGVNVPFHAQMRPYLGVNTIGRAPAPASFVLPPVC